jgi:hypothetical protein
VTHAGFGVCEAFHSYDLRRKSMVCFGHDAKRLESVGNRQGSALTRDAMNSFDSFSMRKESR